MLEISRGIIDVSSYLEVFQWTIFESAKISEIFLRSLSIKRNKNKKNIFEIIF